MANLRIRRSIKELEAEYNLGNSLPLETVIRAFKGIQALDSKDDNSFFRIAGYHGEPFRQHDWPEHDKTDYVPPGYWGGYCSHANVLFPTWHRAYLLRLENAMRTIPGCEDVALPFWDECFDLNTPIPKILTESIFTLDGEPIANPLYSYKLPEDLIDTLGEGRQTKWKGYSTCRFPLSGLVGTKADQEKTNSWNRKFVDAEENINILNKNVSNWLNGNIDIKLDGHIPIPKDLSAVHQRFVDCLNAPNYTVFSNTESAKAYNKAICKEKALAVPLEDPHNAIHLAVGGFYQKRVLNADPDEFKYANGDMGENETASMDPIFFLHHAYIDYVFWRWQIKHHSTKRGNLDVIKCYAGSNSGVDSTPNIPPYTNLTPQTPLYPFMKAKDVPYTSDDVTDIETDLGYTYGTGTMDRFSSPGLSSAPASAPPAKVLRAYGINRSQINGSFVVRTYVKLPGRQDPVEIGREAVLSRWDVKRCRNCQVALPVEALTGLSHEMVGLLESKGVNFETDFSVKLQTHSGLTQDKLNSSAPDGIDAPKIEVL